MKNLITATACVILLLAFLVEFVHSQLLFQQIMEIQYSLTQFERSYVDERENVDSLISSLKEEISHVLECNEGQIQVKTDKLPHSYQVTFPLTKLLSMADFWGLSEEENQLEYVIRRSL